MATYTQNTEYRNKVLTISKYTNGVLNSGYPVDYTITDGFTDPVSSTVYAALTNTEFALLSSTDYTTRLNAYWNYVESLESGYDRSIDSPAPYGTDDVICPEITV